MEQANACQGKPPRPKWFRSKIKVVQGTLLLSICVWLVVQITSDLHAHENPSQQHRLLDSGKSSRKLLSRRWIWEDEGNEAWEDVIASGDERLTRKEDGGGAGDDEFDGDDQEDVERMVKLARQATSDFSATVRELDRGADAFNHEVSNGNGNSSTGGVIDSELHEFFEVESNN
ncbi:unnamed protein product [Linum trigynum]|uniref:Uncharacterized protein n=1 Tax=Linum trigynum TaxID=586398 RepID=A0AAV2DXI9_9ROSI